MKDLLDPDPVERAIEGALVCLAAVFLFAGCTHVTVSGPAAPVPAVEAKQLGGMLTAEFPDGTRLAVDNRDSFRAVTEMADSITGKIAILQGTREILDMRQAKNASDAATEGARIAAGTEAQRIAADQAIQSQQLANEAAAAALAAP